MLEVQDQGVNMDWILVRVLWLLSCCALTWQRENSATSSSSYNDTSPMGLGLHPSDLT